ncbi:hypothetical protein MOV09_08205, partial [Lacticaseibacillus paracasei]|nr:hypothetical protein [Lacticaseibacillus paracasei]
MPRGQTCGSINLAFSTQLAICRPIHIIMKATKRKGWLAMDQNKLKQEAAQRAAEFVEDGMTIG